MDKIFAKRKLSTAIRELEIPMKKCSYCGAEYPDDTIVCAVDQTPLDKTYLAEEPAVAPCIKRKITFIIAWSLAWGLSFFILAWLYRVLTRPDIRDLFCNES